MKRYLTPERLINDPNVDAKMLGMYVTFMANTMDGIHVIKSSNDLRKQMSLGYKTYFKYRNKLAELGYISVSHNDFMMPSVITLKGDNANFIETDIDDVIDYDVLNDDATPQQVFRALFGVDIPAIDLKRIKKLSIPNHVMKLALDRVSEHEFEFDETNYSKLLNYAIKVALDYQKHDVNDIGDAQDHESDYFNGNL